MSRRNNDIPLETMEEAHTRTQRDSKRRPASTSGSHDPARGRGMRRLCALVLLLVVGLACWETGATLLQHLQAATDEDWAAATARLKTERKAGEPVLFAPHWVDPLGRHHVGRGLTMDLLTLSDVDRFARVWLLSVRGKQHPWLRGKPPAQTWRFKAVTLSLFEQKPARVVYDFTANIGEALVQRQGRQLVRCPRKGARFRCDPRQGWNWVGPHLAEVGHRPYRCIFAHAVDGRVMRVTFPAAVLGQTIVGYTGIDDFENRKRSDEAVRLVVMVGDKEVGAVRHLNKWPWTRFTFDTAKFAGQAHPVKFEVTTARAFARTFCFAAEARR